MPNRLPACVPSSSAFDQVFFFREDLGIAHWNFALSVGFMEMSETAIF
jgi:hypothetical protein